MRIEICENDPKIIEQGGLILDSDESSSSSVCDLFPADLASEQDRLSTFLYENVNSGVYQAGFATTQATYEKADAVRSSRPTGRTPPKTRLSFR